MFIQVSSNKSIQNSAELTSQVEAVVQSTLDRFEDQLTGVEVHLEDINSHKGGENDKTCTMEARVEGRNPVVTTNQANELMDAVTGCADKLQRALDSEFGRLRDASRR